MLVFILMVTFDVWRETEMAIDKKRIVLFFYQALDILHML